MFNIELTLSAVFIVEGKKKNEFDEVVLDLHINMASIIAFHPHPVDDKRMVICTGTEEYTIDMSVEQYCKVREKLMEDLQAAQQQPGIMVPRKAGPRIVN